MTDTNRPPLWRVMLAAFSNRWLDIEPISTDNAAGLAYAAEIRTVRDWLVPDGQEPSEHLFDGDSNPQWDRWKERQRLRALLTAEADRAERGD